MADIKKICRYCGHAVPNEKEIRAKAIDEFEKKLFDESYEDYESDKLIIDYADAVLIAEQLKGVQE